MPMRLHLYILIFFQLFIIINTKNIFSSETISCQEAMRAYLNHGFSLEVTRVKSSKEFEKIKLEEINSRYLKATAKLNESEVVEKRTKLRNWINYFRIRTGRNAMVAEDSTSGILLAQLDSIFMVKNEYQIKEYFFSIFMNVTKDYYKFQSNEEFIKGAEAVLSQMHNLDYSFKGLIPRDLKKIIIIKREENKKITVRLGKKFNEFRTLYSKLNTYSKITDPALSEVQKKAHSVLNEFFQSDKFIKQIVAADDNGEYPERMPSLSEIWSVLKNTNYDSMGEVAKLKVELQSEIISFMWRYSLTRAANDFIEQRILSKVPLIKKTFIRKFFRTLRDTQSQRVYFPHIYELDQLYEKVASNATESSAELLSISRRSSVDEYSAELVEKQFDYIVTVNAGTADEFLLTLARRPDQTQMREYLKRFLLVKIADAKTHGIENSSFQQYLDRLVKAEAEALVLGDLHPVSSPLAFQLLSNISDVAVYASGTYLSYLYTKYFMFEQDGELVEVQENDLFDPSVEDLEALSQALKDELPIEAVTQ